eukprot:6433005-Prymnesium_polylepis.1
MCGGGCVAAARLPVRDALGRDGLRDGLVPTAVLPQLVALADVPRAARRVPHHHVGHANHLVNATFRDHAQLHAAVLAELVLEQVVGRGAVDDDARRRRHGDALDIARLLPPLLCATPHGPCALDVLRQLGVGLDLQPAARLAKLLLLTDVPRRLVVRGVREPQHVVRVVVLLVRRSAIELSAGAHILAELVLMDGDVVHERRLARDQYAPHILHDGDHRKARRRDTPIA